MGLLSPTDEKAVKNLNNILASPKHKNSKKDNWKRSFLLANADDPYDFSLKRKMYAHTKCML